MAPRQRGRHFDRTEADDYGVDGPVEAPRVRIKETVVLQKFEGDWTDEQHKRGESAAALIERVVVEDGQVVEHWKKNGKKEGTT